MAYLGLFLCWGLLPASKYGAFDPMSEVRKITIEVPVAALALAQEHCGGSITEAVRQGLERLAADRRRDILLSLEGKVKFSESWQTLRGKDDEDVHGNKI